MASFFDSLDQIANSTTVDEDSGSSDFFGSIDQISNSNSNSLPDIEGNYRRRLEEQSRQEEEVESLIREEESVDTTEHDDFIRGVLRGWEGTKSMAGGAAALLGEMFNSEDLKEWGLDYYQEHEQEAGQYEKAKFTEDPLDWIQGTLGELAPTMAQSMVGAFVGGIAGGGIGSVPGALTGLAGKKVVSKSVEKLFQAKLKTTASQKLIADLGKDAAEAKIKQQAQKAIAKSIGAKVGLVGATAQMEIGGNYGEASDAYGEDASVTSAIATGMTSALLELAGGNIRIIDKVLGADTAKVFKKAIGTKDAGLITRIAKEAVKQAPAEAMQESMQEFMSLVNLKGNDSEYEIWTKENVMRMAEAAGAGLTGGLAFGALTGIAANPKTFEDYKEEAKEHAAKTVELTGNETVDKTNITKAENEYLTKVVDEKIAQKKAQADKKGLSFLKAPDQEVNDLDNAIAKGENKVRSLEKVIAAKKAKGVGLDKIVEGYANAISELETLKGKRGDKDVVAMKSVDQIVVEQTKAPTADRQEVEPEGKPITEEEATAALLGEEPLTTEKVESDPEEAIAPNREATNTIEDKALPKTEEVAPSQVEPEAAQAVEEETAVEADETAVQDEIVDLETVIEERQDALEVLKEEGDAVEVAKVERLLLEDVAQLEKLKKQAPVEKKAVATEVATEEKATDATPELTQVKNQIAALEKTNPTSKFQIAQKNLKLKSLNKQLTKMEKANGKQATTQAEGTKEGQETNQEAGRNRTEIQERNMQEAEVVYNEALKEHTTIQNKHLEGRGIPVNQADYPADLKQAQVKVDAAKAKHLAAVKEYRIAKGLDPKPAPAIKVAKSSTVFKVGGKDKQGKKIEVEGFENETFIAVENTAESKAGSPKVYDVIEAETGSRIATVSGHANIKEAVAAKLTTREAFDKAKKSKLKKNKANAAKEQTHEEVVQSIPPMRKVKLNAVINGKQVTHEMNAREAFETLSKDYKALIKALNSDCL